jgi:hypothetical protein
VQPDGYKVVATIAEGEDGLPLRFEVTITDNQKPLISVPEKVAEQSEVLEISTVGDKLLIAQPPQFPTKSEIIIALTVSDGDLPERLCRPGEGGGCSPEPRFPLRDRNPP